MIDVDKAIDQLLEQEDDFSDIEAGGYAETFDMDFDMIRSATPEDVEEVLTEMVHEIIRDQIEDSSAEAKLKLNSVDDMVAATINVTASNEDTRIALKMLANEDF